MDEITPLSQEAWVTLGTYLKDDGWFPEPRENQLAYRVNYNGKSIQFLCHAQIKGDLDQFLFYAVCPVKIQEPLRLTVAEYLTRANYGMRIGNFEMDFSDGEVRFKSSLDFEGVGLDRELIHRAIYPAVQMMDKYMPGLLQVMTGALTPERAINQVEGTHQDNGTGTAEGYLGS